MLKCTVAHHSVAHTKYLLTKRSVGYTHSCFFTVELHEEWEDKENVVEFDFLGKDSVRYWNFVPVEKKVCFHSLLRGFPCFYC